MNQRPSRGLEITWLVLACFPFLNGIGFIIAGASGRTLRWALWGIGMLAILIPVSIIDGMYATQEELDKSVAYNIAMGVAVAVWLGGIYLAFRIRGAWRLAVAGRQPAQAPARPFTPPQAVAQPVAEPVALAPSYAQPAPSTSPPRTAPPSVPPASETATAPVDANSATTADLASAGLREDLAQRVVSARDTGGPYTSLEDLAARARLKPHELASVHQRLVVTPPARRAPASPTGRIVDV